MAGLEDLVPGRRPSGVGRGLALVGASAVATALLTLAARQLAATLLTAALLSWLLYRFALRRDVPPVWPVAAMLLPFTIGLVDTVYPFMPVFGDAAQYDHLGRVVAQSLQRRVPTDYPFGSLQVRTYSYVLGSVYTVLGTLSPVALAFNGWFWGLAVTLWLQMTARVADRSAVHYAGALYVVYPAAVMYSSVVLREAIALCLLTVALWLWLRWLREGGVPSAAGGVLALVPVVLLRAEVLPPVFVGIAAGWVLKHRDEFTPRRAGGLAAGGSLATAAFWVIDRQLSTHLNPFDVSVLESVRSNSAAGPNGYLRGLEYTGLIDVFLQLPLRMLFLLLTPFPWLVSSYDQFLATADALFVAAVLCCAGYFLLRTDLLTATNGFLLGYTVSLFTGYSLIVSQSGVASRRRLYAVPVLVLFAAAGLSLLRDRVRVPDRDGPRDNKV